MEGGWIITGLPKSPKTTTPAAPFSLNPNANEFVPKNVENNGSSTSTSLPPAPFRPKIQQSMPISQEITNAMPPGFYPPQLADAHPQYVPVPIYGPTIIPTCVVAHMCPLQFNPNQLTVATEIFESTLELQEESDHKKSVTASNEELNNSADNNVSQIRGPMKSRESSIDNNRPSWIGEHADDRSARSADLKQPYYGMSRGLNENSHLRDRGTRFRQGNINFTNKGHKHSVYQDNSADPTNEECFNESSDIHHKKGYNEGDYGRYRERRSRSFRGNGNFSYGYRRQNFDKNYDRHENRSGQDMRRQYFKENDRASDRNSEDLSNFSPLDENPVDQIMKTNEQRVPNEFDSRRGREKRNDRDKETDFRHKETSDSISEAEDSQGKYESIANIDKKAKYEHLSEKGTKNWEASNFSQDKSVGPSRQDPLGLSDKNDQMWPSLNDQKRDRRRGNGKMRDKGNSRIDNKQTSFEHQELTTNPKHRDSPKKYGSSNDKSLHEANAFLGNKSEPKIENTEESRKETKIQQSTYNEKAQDQNTLKKFDHRKKNDWSDRTIDKGSTGNQKQRSKFPEDSKKETYDKRKRNTNLEVENPENKCNNLGNQPRNFDSERENVNVISNTRNKGSDNCEFEGRDDNNTETHQSSYEKESNTDLPDSMVDSEEPRAQTKKGRPNKETNKHSVQKSVSMSHQSYSDASNGNKQGNSSDFGDNLSLMERLMAEEKEIRIQNKVCENICPTVKADKKKTTRKPDDFENKKLLDPRMERKKGNEVDGNKGMTVTKPRESSSLVVTSYVDDSLEKEKRDKEYDIWDNHWEEIDNFKIVCEIQGNLFEQPKDFSLAHCVAEDLRMGSGIAVDFKREFKNIPNLLDQRAKQGGLATIEDPDNGRFVYYLVTKKDSTGKPTYYTMWKALCKMRDHVKKNEVQKLAIPRLGCGLDRLEWDKVKSMIEYLFREMKTEIRVCNFQQPEQSTYNTKCKLVVEDVPVTKIDPGTLILYLASTKGEEDNVIKNMSKKFNFWPSFAKQEKALGDIVYFDDKFQNYGICACIVRKTRQEPISFVTLHSCLQKINKKNKDFGNDCFQYVALQWVDSNDYFDESINQKLITMLINFLRNVDVYICNGDFEEQNKSPST